MTPRKLASTALVLMVLTAGCTGGGSSDSSGAMSKPMSGAAQDSSGGENAATKEGGGEGTGGGGDSAREQTSARVLPSDRDIVYRGAITVRVRDVARAATRAQDLAEGVDGVVFSVQISRGDRRTGAGEANLSLRVPPTHFAATLDSLGRLGKELDRTRSAKDVTTELADTGSRVRSQERSIARLQAMLDEADTIGEVVQVESELTRREADLESLQAQLARLKDVTDLSTIDVTLVAPGTPVAPAPEDDDLGFVSGLRGGWDAFVGIVLVALTVLGALVPFTIAAAVLGFPAYALLRSRRRPLTTPGAPPATGPTA